jgi:hypothetical protein
VGGTSPAKLVGFLIGFLCLLLAIVALVVTFTLPSTISCHDGDVTVRDEPKRKKGSWRRKRIRCGREREID